ncbi:MAG: hypothetical protein ABW168_26695 [Sedimenticola sp.]
MQSVRDSLKDITELSSRDVRERVAAQLEKKLGVEARIAYENKPQVSPILMYSSFEAWRGLPFPRNSQKEELENPVITGFLSQLNTMKPALEATVARALKEEQDIILEGVHVVPTHLDCKMAKKNAIVVPIMLATIKKGLLKQRLKHRGRERAEKQPPHGTDNIDDIWELQSYLLNEADVAGVPIIHSPNIEKTVREILLVVSNKIIKHFPAHKKYGGDDEGLEK